METWEAQHDGPARSNDWGRDVAVSPDGGRVFVTGEDYKASGREYATVAYDRDGVQVWEHHHPRGEWAEAMAVAPAGDVVVVTGFGAGVTIETVAINVADGTTRWAHTYVNRDAQSGWAWDKGEEVLFTPDGSTVLVAGTAKGPDGSTDVVTLALDAKTGTQRWRAAYASPIRGEELVSTMALSPDGKRVYVAGSTAASATGGDIVVLAYDVPTGSEAWRRAHDLDGRRDVATGLAVGPEGRIYVAGAGLVGGDGIESYDSVVLALSLTGSLLWERRDLAGPGVDSPGVIRVSNDGTRLFTAGGQVAPNVVAVSTGTVVARAASDGAVLWTSQPMSGRFVGLSDMALTPDGSALLVGGNVDLGLGLPGWDYGVAVLAAGDGAVRWATRYDGSGMGYDNLRAVAVSPDGRRGYVTGSSQTGSGASTMDYTTLAYCLQAPRAC